MSSPGCSAAALILAPVASAVRCGLTAEPKSLPPWLFYDEQGSALFDRITELPEYYLTRTERSIFEAHADEIVRAAAGGLRLRVTELGAGSADKTRTLLAAVARLQPGVVYEPIDVSPAALDAARDRLAAEMPGVTVAPRVEDYTAALVLDPTPAFERRLVLYIGSSIGNFDPGDAFQLLQTVRAALVPGDSLLLGVDLVKDEATLLAAYDDADQVTAAFNRNILARLNRDLGADFVPEAFAHRAVWNVAASRIEMHLESLRAQTVNLPALDLTVEFAAGERMHTENSYKYRPGQAEALLSDAGFTPTHTWTDTRRWFAVCLARVV
ncbi:MAG TPA: L-histidine N(alpha)-methyltransferase [Terracidiphilus sp.]|nr:L-histidine N(alpha)-methyltransferase [Terracidiphilus sp.]